MEFDNKANEEELRNLFNFLGGEEKVSNHDSVSANHLLFALENYGLPFPGESIRVMKNEIEKIIKTGGGQITFEEFKQLWHINVDQKFNTKDLTAHLYNILLEFLEEREENKIQKTKKPGLEMKLDEDQLYWLMEQLGVFDETPAEDEESSVSTQKKRKNSGTSNKSQKNTKIVKNMIESLSMNGKDVTIKDFEFLIGQYLQHIK
jgi:hypothetical protein